MAPQMVDKLTTLKVAKLITLWRPRGGQTNNSPAYVYIHRNIYIYIPLWLSLSLYPPSFSPSLPLSLLLVPYLPSLSPNLSLYVISLCGHSLVSPPPLPASLSFFIYEKN